MIDVIEKKVGKTLFDWQRKAVESAADQLLDEKRLCLYYATGKGKSLTSLACMVQWEQTEVVVLAPPSTHPEWEALGKVLDLELTIISHAKFRQKDYRLSRTRAIVVDEVHLLGGHQGKGWKKLDTLARHLKAPLILMSATPNYNDAERVYCIQHVLDPYGTKGGYLAFLYANCVTEQDPFSNTPKVLGFQRYQNAAEYLADLPFVEYLPDTLVYTIEDIPMQYTLPTAFDEFGLDARRNRIMASDIERRHAVVRHALLRDDGKLRSDIVAILEELIAQANGQVMIFANHSEIASAAYRAFTTHKVALVTGDTPKPAKAAALDNFRHGWAELLIGTASLATGTDGLDKVCDLLIILDDTDDDSLRRQLIGRIMPRGEGADASSKRVVRLVL